MRVGLFRTAYSASNLHLTASFLPDHPSRCVHMRTYAKGVAIAKDRKTRGTAVYAPLESAVLTSSVRSPSGALPVWSPVLAIISLVASTGVCRRMCQKHMGPDKRKGKGSLQLDAVDVLELRRG